MNRKRGPLAFLIAAVVAIMMMLGAFIPSASGDEGVQTPIATATAIADDAVVQDDSDSSEPVDEPTGQSPQPTAESTIPTQEPEAKPEPTNTSAPAEDPTEEPTQEPTNEPSGDPTEEPTEGPSDEPTDEPTEEPSEEPTEEPSEEPNPPLEDFIDLKVESCQVTITQKPGVDWTEIIVENGTPDHWGIGIGNETVVISPVDPTKPVIIRIIVVIDNYVDYEYFRDFKLSDSCNAPDPGPKPDIESGETVSSSLACGAEGGLVTTTTTPWTQDWVLVDGEWVLDAKVYGDPVETTRPATEEECPTSSTPTPTPTPDPTPTPTPDPDPTDKPTKPDPDPTGKPTTKPTAKPDSTDKPSKSDPKKPSKTGVVDESVNTTSVLATGAVLLMVVGTVVAVRRRLS